MGWQRWPRRFGRDHRLLGGSPGIDGGFRPTREGELGVHHGPASAAEGQASEPFAPHHKRSETATKDPKAGPKVSSNAGQGRPRGSRRSINMASHLRRLAASQTARANRFSVKQ